MFPTAVYSPKQVENQMAAMQETLHD